MLSIFLLLKLPFTLFFRSARLLVLDLFQLMKHDVQFFKVLSLCELERLR